MRVTKFAIPEVIFGRGSIKHLAPCALSLGARKVFLVSDPGVAQAGWLALVQELLSEAKLSCEEFCEVNANPRDAQVHQGANQYLAAKADVIISLGGGSPMDTAKGIGIIASNGGKISDYEGANRIRHPLPPMIFLPTTAGSGSDLSQFCIITDMKRKLKMSIISRSLLPNISITDPDFLATKSTALIVDSAIDALAHAVESYLSPATSPLSENQARFALRLWAENIGEAYHNRSPKALENLSMASAAAGMSFSNAGLGIGHALAHAIGGRLDLRHGMMHSILLPAVMSFNLPYSTEKMGELLGILFPKRKFGTMKAMLDGIATLEALFASMDVPIRLRHVLPDESCFPEVCKAAVHDACMLTNPRPASVDDLLEICRERW